MFQVFPLFFTESTDMSCEDEIKEVYYAFSHLGWDKVTSRIINALKENHHTDLQSMIEEGAYLRRFFG